MPLHLLLTAGPTREPLDPVRYLGNRSSGQMAAAIAHAAVALGLPTTVITGPVSVTYPPAATVVPVETAQQMHDQVLHLLPTADLVIMAAAVADFRPATVSAEKLSRASGPLTLTLEPTPDIARAASARKSPHQRIIGFSLERDGNLDRARHKLLTKNLDMIVYNPLPTMGSSDISPTLLYPSGQQEEIGCRTKASFADILMQRALALFPG
jgi:phosphopantothenoylcysteine decarboxylase/phosphopantothenate--cysteine ligase